MELEAYVRIGSEVLSSIGAVDRILLAVEEGRTAVQAIRESIAASEGSSRDHSGVVRLDHRMSITASVWIARSRYGR